MRSANSACTTSTASSRLRSMRSAFRTRAGPNALYADRGSVADATLDAHRVARAGAKQAGGRSNESEDGDGLHDGRSTADATLDTHHPAFVRVAGDILGAIRVERARPAIEALAAYIAEASAGRAVAPVDARIAALPGVGAVAHRWAPDVGGAARSPATVIGRTAGRADAVIVADPALALG